MNLEISIEYYRNILDRITDGFIVLDKNYCYIYVNQRVGEMVHRDPASLIGKNVWEEFPDAVGSLTYKAFLTAMNEQRFISIVDYYQPLDLWQENYIYPSPEGLSIFIRDVTDKKKLEQELRQKEINRQFDIIVTTLEAQEKERTYIGRELHDNVNQLLVATKLMLSLYRDKPEKITGTIISRCIENLERSIEENRRISHELVTPNLKDESLVEQITFLVQSMFTENTIEARIDVSQLDETKLALSTKLAVYRIAQEQCSNILKHSGAKKVHISLSTKKDEFTMIIADDGQGTEHLKDLKGIGLRNIQARLEILKGQMHIQSEPGNGFKLEITIPLEKSFQGTT